MKKTYWHATPAENLTSIISNGLKPGFDGVSYFSDDPVKCALWMSFCRRDAKEIIAIPFEIEESEMRLGIDHSPMMTKMLGIEDEGASFVNPNVLRFRDHCDISLIKVFQNTFAMSDEEITKFQEEHNHV